MTCEEALRRLYEVIDKEASEIDVKEVQEHLAHCENCMARYEFEAMFKTFVCDKASSSPKADDLKKRILTRIDESEDKPNRFFNRPFRYQAVIIAAAAALILCIVAAFSVAGYYRYHTFIEPFENCHMAGVQAYRTSQADDPAIDPRDPEVLAFLQKSIPVTVNDSMPGFLMIGSCLDNIQNCRFAHFQYAHDQSLVSLFVGNDDGINLPGFEQVTIDGIDFYQYTCKSCQIMYWKENGMIMVAVSEDKTLELSEIRTVLSAI
ncbi:MAG: zf-HC2 domain-containing protein [candidate division Zixibacteria bacterium]|nr:zf-HC2 domain-containing protein [candidate division Zixibacteria bacterium]